jgi:HEAT repeat protein
MPTAYAPASEFLQGFTGDRSLAESDIGQLIILMRDKDASNRDWATFLIASEDFDTPAIRGALLVAARDDSENVRAEAILGLARRDPALALPLVQEALRADHAQIPMFEAAELCAHPSLIADLRVWAEPSDEPYVDKHAADALAACEHAAMEDRST